jgi:Transglutaminase-like superfamily
VWSKLGRFGRLSFTQKRLLGEALLGLALARAAILFLPFRRIAAWLGSPGAVSPNVATEAELRVAKEVGWAVGVVARRVPWDGRCLAQALAATGMLRRRGLDGTVSFGAGQAGDAETGFVAHAWLQVGPCIVTGGPGHEQFKRFTTFARKQQ